LKQSGSHAKDGNGMVVFKAGTKRTAGADAKRSNIEVAVSISDRLRTSLSPAGMDKMLVDYFGRDPGEFNFDISKDGMAILEQMQKAYSPSAQHVIRLIMSAARTQDYEMGDGTKTVAILTGELLKGALKLLNGGVHQTVIRRGYSLAARKAAQLLERMATDVSKADDEILRKVALTAIKGKVAEDLEEHLANLAVEATKAVAEKTKGEKIRIERDRIKIEKWEGGSARGTELIRGVTLSKGRANPSMPARVEDARIAIITSGHVKVKDTRYSMGQIDKETQVDVLFKIKDPKQIKELRHAEDRILEEMAAKIKDVGANVLLTEKGVDDHVVDLLTRGGILAIPGVYKYDIDKLAKATGARPVAEAKKLTPADLGYAGTVEEVKKGNEPMTFVKNCRNPKAVTIVLRGSTRQILDEIEAAVKDCLGVVATVIKSGKVLPGGGAPEITVASQLRTYATTFGRKEQLAIRAFADGLDGIAEALAENAGMDPVDAVIRLRALNKRHKSKRLRNGVIGINVLNGTFEDAFAAGILEPLAAKMQSITSAGETASMILKADDVIVMPLRPPDMHCMGS
jgi:chaperonin GroEL (HSP60 family)